MEDIFRIAEGTPMTAMLLSEYITRNDNIVKSRYIKLWKAYNNDYKIFHQRAKAPWKPDNRLAVNFAQYITDTFEGLFLGNPVKITSEDEAVSEYVNFLDAYNDQDDGNSELSTLCSIFGRAYELYYTDEDSEVCTAYLDPMEAFMIYNDSIKPKPVYFVRTYIDANKKRRGSISDGTTVRYFRYDPDLVFEPDGEQPHYFDGVPAVEYVQNRARRGIFESVLPLIDTYNKALSEKANDVDYFSDAYLKILGKRLDRETIRFMRENRVINFEGSDADKLIVEFMQKPSGDDTQEHLLDRLEKLIFTTSMVCNISDESFATSSGIALKYKLLPMLNLAKKKERKFTSGMNRRYRLIFSNPVSPVGEDDWVKLQYTFTPNIPADLADEASTAGQLAGITSRKTQLKVLSVVDDVDKELEQIEKEEEEVDTLGYDIARLQEVEEDEDADRDNEKDEQGGETNRRKGTQKG